MPTPTELTNEHARHLRTIHISLVLLSMAILVAVYGDSDRAIDAALVQLRTIRSVVDESDSQLDYTYIDRPSIRSFKGTYYFRDVADPDSVCKVVVENEYLWKIYSDGGNSWSHSDDYFSLFDWDECTSLTEFKSDWERLRSDFDYVFARGLHGNIHLLKYPSESDEEPEVREFEPIEDHDGPVLVTFRNPRLFKGSDVPDEFGFTNEATINFSDDAIQSHAAIRVQTAVGSSELLLGLIKHLRQRNRSTFLKWRSQPFASMFPELDEITAEYQDLNFDRLDTILTKEKEQRKSEDLKTFGLTIPSGLIGYLGIPVLLCMQVFFAVHLMAARPRLRRATVPWIGLYGTTLSRCIVGLSAVALPVFISWIVCFRTSSAVDGFGHIVLIVSTVGVFIVAGEIAVLLRPQKWGGDIADVPEDVKSANERAKHLRFVHFSLVVVSVTLIASSLLDRSSAIIKAIAQLETVRIAIDNLDDSKFFEDHAREVWDDNAAHGKSEWLFRENETSGNARVYQVIPSWGEINFVPKIRDMSKLADFKAFWDRLLPTDEVSVFGKAGPQLFFALSDILDENYEDNPMEEGVENFVIMDRVKEPSDDQISGAIPLYLEGYTNAVDLNDFGIDPGVEFEFLLGGDYESWGVPILPVDYVDLEFGWLDVYVEEVLAIDPDVFGDWRVAPFAKTFSELDQAAVHYQDLDIEWLVRILRRESDRTSGSRFEALGVSASIRLLGWIGLPVMLGIQLYFLLHLLSAKGSLCRADFPWIGLYKTKSARLVLAVSAVLLPSAVAVVLSIHVARSGTTVQSLISFAIATAVVTVASLTWSRLGFPTLFRSNA